MQSSITSTVFHSSVVDPLPHAPVKLGERIYALQSDMKLMKCGLERVCMLRGNVTSAYCDEPYTLILPLIDGVNSDEEIAGKLSTVLDPALVYYCLLMLEDHGHIRALNDRQDGSCSMVQQRGLPPEATIAVPQNIIVESDDDEEKTLFIEALRNICYRAGVGGARETVHVLLCSDYCDPEIRGKVSEAMSKKHVCYLVRLSGDVAWFGPFLKPGQRPCFECVRHQIMRNRPVETHLLTKGYIFEPRGSKTVRQHSGLAAAAYLAAVRLMHLIDDASSEDTFARIETFNSTLFQIERHLLRVRPQCGCCGSPSRFSTNVKKPVELHNAYRLCNAEGGYRTRRPEETWERLKHLVSPLTGVITEIAPLASRNHALRPVYYASYFVHPTSGGIMSQDRYIVRSYGKGKGALQARTSALCEAIERYCAMYQGDEPIIRGSYRELSNEAVDPRILMNFSEHQYVTGGTAPRPSGTGNCVPLPFDETAVIDWTYAWSITGNKRRLIPATFCYMFYPVEEKERVCPFTSNGNAAGNTLEEAILQGFLELVERDAVAIWWYNRLDQPEVDLESFNDPYFLEIRQHYRELGWDYWVLDLTHDFQIPVVASIGYHEASCGYIIGMGCHLDMYLAVQRAITEMHQVYDPVANGLWKRSEFQDDGFMHPNRNCPLVDAGTYPHPTGYRIDEAIWSCIKKAETNGLETIVVDYTRPDIELNTVKVIVPGLRHFFKRLGKGRLYDVPVKMGWRGRALMEHEVNPIPLQT